MPTRSPGWMVAGSICSRDSSTRTGVPADGGVAAARTNNHRGVITAVPKELSLGLTRWTLNAAAFRHNRGDCCDRSGLRERPRAKHDCLPAIRLFSYGHIVHARTV